MAGKELGASGRPKKFRCGEKDCGARFRDEIDLQNHCRAKHGHAKLRCTEENCQEEFARRHGLLKHMKTWHKE